jgi:ribosome biogenesis protein ENP2
VRSRVEKERASRIRTAGKVKVKVNQAVADRLVKKQESKAKTDAAATLLQDDRFKSFFEDDEFKVDETSKEFRALNPSTVATATTTTTTTTTTQKDSGSDSDSDSDSGSDSDSPEPPQKPAVAMRVSSSQHRAGRPLRDTALGSRAHKTKSASSTTPRESKVQVLGEQQVTFVPQARKRRPQEDSTGGGVVRRRTEGRRSASSNTFRKM